MAYRSAPIADDIIWRAAPQPEDASLADAVRETIASTRKHLLDFIRLDETPPPAAMTLPVDAPRDVSFIAGRLFRSHLSAHAACHVKNKPLLSYGRNGISG